MQNKIQTLTDLELITTIQATYTGSSTEIVQNAQQRISTLLATQGILTKLEKILTHHPSMQLKKAITTSILRQTRQRQANQSMDDRMWLNGVQHIFDNITIIPTIKKDIAMALVLLQQNQSQERAFWKINYFYSTNQLYLAFLLTQAHFNAPISLKTRALYFSTMFTSLLSQFNRVMMMETHRNQYFCTLAQTIETLSFEKFSSVIPPIMDTDLLTNILSAIDRNETAGVPQVHILTIVCKIMHEMGRINIFPRYLPTTNLLINIAEKQWRYMIEGIIDISSVEISSEQSTNRLELLNEAVYCGILNVSLTQEQLGNLINKLCISFQNAVINLPLTDMIEAIVQGSTKMESKTEEVLLNKLIYAICIKQCQIGQLLKKSLQISLIQPTSPLNFIFWTLILQCKYSFHPHRYLIRDLQFMAFLKTIIPQHIELLSLEPVLLFCLIYMDQIMFQPTYQPIWQLLWNNISHTTTLAIFQARLSRQLPYTTQQNIVQKLINLINTSPNEQLFHSIFLITQLYPQFQNEPNSSTTIVQICSHLQYIFQQPQQRQYQSGLSVLAQICNMEQFLPIWLECSDRMIESMYKCPWATLNCKQILKLIQCKVTHQRKISHSVYTLFARLLNSFNLRQLIELQFCILIIKYTDPYDLCNILATRFEVDLMNQLVNCFDKKLLLHWSLLMHNLIHNQHELLSNTSLTTITSISYHLALKQHEFNHIKGKIQLIIVMLLYYEPIRMVTILQALQLTDLIYNMIYGNNHVYRIEYDLPLFSAYQLMILLRGFKGYSKEQLKYAGISFSAVLSCMNRYCIQMRNQEYNDYDSQGSLQQPSELKQEIQYTEEVLTLVHPPQQLNQFQLMRQFIQKIKGNPITATWLIDVLQGESIQKQNNLKHILNMKKFGRKVRYILRLQR